MAERDEVTEDTLQQALESDAPVIRVRGLVNRFGKQTVHDGVDLDVRRGEIIGVVGGSGSGTSVLMRSILGLRTPDASKCWAWTRHPTTR